ncbi:ZNF407 [Branchiostoma lanceolatum]|uniref:ZNF407 protein n=1 Tax=Branchiostoma lanceolatum TaxID=7740 RepID=A0A8K0EXR3_BRALA|nr:ZNF407 [Branchiostoma lanceolatum]
MEEEDDDTHQCRACKMVILGLDNYVQHRNFSCVRLVGKKSQNAESKTGSDPVAKDGTSRCPEDVRDANAGKADIISEAFVSTFMSTFHTIGAGTESENHPASSSVQSPTVDKDAAENSHSQPPESDTVETGTPGSPPMIMTVECVDEKDHHEEPRSQKPQIPFLLTPSTTRMDFSCKTCGVEFNNTFEIKKHLASKQHLRKVGCAKDDAEKTKENRSEEGERPKSPPMAMTVDCVNDDLSSDDGCGFGAEDMEDEDTPQSTGSASKVDGTEVQGTYCDRECQRHLRVASRGEVKTRKKSDDPSKRRKVKRKDAGHRVDEGTASTKSEAERSLQNGEESANGNEGEARREDSNSEVDKETFVDISMESSMQNDNEVRNVKKRKKRKKKLTEIDSSDCSSDELSEASDDKDRKKTKNNGNAPSHAKPKKTYRKRAAKTDVFACEKPHKCPHCSYRCNDVDNLKKHILNTKRHQGLKLYNCSSCDDFRTNKLRELFDHLKSTHRMDIVRDYQGSFLTGVTPENMNPRFRRISSGNAPGSAGSTNKEEGEVGSAIAAIIPDDNIPDGESNIPDGESNIPDGESGEATEPSKAVSILEDLVEEMSASLHPKEEEQQDT